MIKNETPYIGKIKLKFEKHPYYRGGGNGILNKIHLDLGFTKLVSRLIPIKVLEGQSNVSVIKIGMIERFTGGKIRTHRWGENNEYSLKHSFVTDNGMYIGNIEIGWWYYKNKFYVCQEHPHGVAIKLKNYSPTNMLKNYIKNQYENFVTEQIENDNIEGYYGYTHRGGCLFKIGDRLFDDSYIPVESDYSKKEWKKWNSKLQKRLKSANEFDKKWLTEDGISGFIPFNKRGNKVIMTWEDARQAAINISNYLS